MNNEFSQKVLEADGFCGRLTFAERCDGNSAAAPQGAGVYVVVRSSADKPGFLKSNPGGRFKGGDSTVAPEALEANWVAGAESCTSARPPQ
jgi:hypothetical protein